MIPDYPPPPRFVITPDRPHVTEEPPRTSISSDPRYPDVDWISYSSQGGGSVPADFEWTTNPKQHQDEHSAG